MKILDYSAGFRIVSIALDEETKDDLTGEGLDVLFLTDKKQILFPEELDVQIDKSDLEKLLKCNNYDIFEIWPDGLLYQKYDNASIDNYFFVTGKCNSNCIMCPSPDAARMISCETQINDLIKIASHMPNNARHLTITGGEPFMAGEAIFDFLSYLRDKFFDTEFLILTNGRIFAVEKYAQLLWKNMPDICVLAIPIHGASESVHDSITQVEGSFRQTYFGIKRLLKMGLRIELRIVVSRLNIRDFSNIARLIVKEFPDVEYVSIIAMEMTGSAYFNRDKVWVSYREAARCIEEPLMYMIKNGINVKIYNFPLCAVNQRFWPICERSISPHKVRYAKTCEECNYKSVCGGVFAGTLKLVRDELKAIK